MEQLRKLLNELEVLERISNEADEAYQNDYMNEEVEQAFDIAWNNEYNKKKEVANYIAVYTSLKISPSEAMAMINNQLVRAKIVNLLVGR